MSERSISLLLEDIKVAITTIFDFTNGYTFENFIADLKTLHAVERNFEIIGEAVSRLPQDYKDKHPQVEWRIIKDFRNFIIHEYFGVNHQILWDTIQFRLSDLLITIARLQDEALKYSPP